MTAADRWRALIGKRVLYASRRFGTLNSGNEVILEGTVKEVTDKGYVGILAAGESEAVYWYAAGFVDECEVFDS